MYSRSTPRNFINLALHCFISEKSIIYSWKKRSRNEKGKKRMARNSLHGYYRVLGGGDSMTGGLMVGGGMMNNNQNNDALNNISLFLHAAHASSQPLLWHKNVQCCNEVLVLSKFMT